MHAPQLARTLQHFNNRIRRNIIYARLSKLTTLPSTSTKLHVRLSTFARSSQVCPVLTDAATFTMCSLATNERYNRESRQLESPSSQLDTSS